MTLGKRTLLCIMMFSILFFAAMMSVKNDFMNIKKKENLSLFQKGHHQITMWLYGKEETYQSAIQTYLQRVASASNDSIKYMMEWFSHFLLNIQSNVQSQASKLIHAIKLYLSDNFGEIVLHIVVLSVIYCLLTLFWLVIKIYLLSDNRNEKEINNIIKHSKTKRRPGHISRISLCQKFVVIIICIFFFISIPWEFIRLYQHALAEKAAVVFQGIPPECLPKDMSYYDSMKSWFVWQISWNHSPCEQYHKAILVNPIWEVTPLMVVSSAFTRCITKPLELISSCIALCFKLIFSEIPAQWQPIIMFILTVMSILITLMCCSYQVHMPLIFKLKPGSHNQFRSDPIKNNSKHESYQNNIKLVENDSIEYNSTEAINSEDSSVSVDLNTSQGSEFDRSY